MPEADLLQCASELYFAFRYADCAEAKRANASQIRQAIARSQSNTSVAAWVLRRVLKARKVLLETKEAVALDNLATQAHTATVVREERASATTIAFWSPTRFPTYHWAHEHYKMLEYLAHFATVLP